MAGKEELVMFCADKWYDEDLQSLAEDSHTSKDLFLFIFCFQDLCAKPKSAKGGESKKLRISAWQLLDFNGNKIVSLAETGKFVGERLINFYADKDLATMGVGAEDAKLLYKRFYPCFIRAVVWCELRRTPRATEPNPELGVVEPETERGPGIIEPGTWARGDTVELRWKKTGRKKGEKKPQGKLGKTQPHCLGRENAYRAN
jgi:hypothetical protein